MDTASLTTGHLYLRPPEARDAVDVQAACADLEVQRWTTVPSPYTLTDAETWTGRVTAQGWADGTTASFAVLHATTGRLQGAVSLMGIADGSAELGYWTAPWGRGQGFTAEAVSAVCRWGFGALGLSRVLWRADVGNWGSRAVAEACGFTVEGTQRLGLTTRDGRRVDGWTGSLLADDDATDRRAFGSWRDLTGDGVVLRRWRDDDVDAVVAALSDEESARWLDVPVPYAAQDARDWLEGTRRRWADGVAAPLAVEVDGAVAGLLVLLPWPHDGAVAELGWWTLPSARGRGVTARAVRALLPWAAARGYARLEALVDPANSASQRVATGAGMQLEGVRRSGLRPLRGGPRRDAQVYGLVLEPVR